MIIISKNNPLVKELALLKEKKHRKLCGTFLVEGEKMVRECVACGLNIRRLVLREDYAGETYSLPTVVLGEDAFRFVCDAVTPQGIAAEVEIPNFPLDEPKGRCLVLDGVSDPSNVGAIIRTANAANYRELYLIDCADPFSPKCVRSSMSGVFHVKLMQGSRGEVLHALKGVPLIAADMNGEDVFAFRAPAKFAICLGNEGNGLSDAVRRSATHTVCIPMEKTAESLNVAVSAGIIMYALRTK
ncbi:MAG: RNA methyltransferase [Clostridiales bacterium]|nr:RNA methyltransferase [Clostridiales bacterium]